MRTTVSPDLVHLPKLSPPTSQVMLVILKKLYIKVPVFFLPSGGVNFALFWENRTGLRVESLSPTPCSTSNCNETSCGILKISKCIPVLQNTSGCLLAAICPSLSILFTLPPVLPLSKLESFHGPIWRYWGVNLRAILSCAVVPFLN